MSEFPFRIIKNTKNTTTVGKTSLSLVAHSNPCVILHCSVRDFVNGTGCIILKWTKLNGS